MNILYYIGAIISDLGVALFAILLVIIGTKISDEVKRSDYESLTAVSVFLFIILGVIMQIIGLFELVKV